MISLPSFSAAITAGACIAYVLWSSGHAAAQGEPSADQPVQSNGGSATEALALLKSAREKIYAHQPIQAEVYETVRIGDRHVVAQGRYVQGNDLKLRLEMDVRTHPSGLGGALLQVCDGQILFTRYTIGEEVRLTRRDVRQILLAAAESGAPETNVLVAELGLGGLPALLASLEQSMTFSAVRRVEVDGQELTLLEAEWSPQFRQELLGPDAKPSDPLPQHVPDRLQVYLDANRFPHRIAYLKRSVDEDVFRPMVTLDFRNVVLRAAPDDREFLFVPPKGVRPTDITKAFIERLKSGRQTPPAGASNASPQSPLPAGR